MVNDGEVRWGLLGAVCPSALVDSRQIVQHFVWLLDAGFQVGQNLACLIPRRPERRDAIRRFLGSDCFRAESLLKRLRNRLCQDRAHTLSIVLNSVACCRAGRFMSRSEGIAGRSTP